MNKRKWSVSQVLRQCHLCHKFKILNLWHLVIAVATVVTIVTGCAKGIKPDYSLIRPWTKSLQKKEPHTVPYITEFHHAGRTLTYIAIRQEETLKKSVFRTVKKVFKENKPNRLLVGGYEGGTGTSPEWIIKDVKKCAKLRFKTCGGADFTVWQAYKNKVDFLSVEPPESHVHEKVTDKGYQSEDMLGFYLVREIIELKKDKKIKLRTLPKVADQFLQTISAKIKLEKTFEYEDFLIWYKRFNEERFVFDEIKASLIQPNYKKSGSAMQNLGLLFEKIHEHYVLDMILDQVSRNKVTALVMDVKYLVKHRKVLEKALGRPVHVKY